MPQWKQRPEGSNWGDFGPDDQLGRVNLLAEAQVLKGAAEVRVGKTFCLSLPLDLPGGNVLHPRRFPPRLAPTCLGEDRYINYPLARHNPAFRDVVSDDEVRLSLQYSSQWDSLAHVGALFDADADGEAEIRYYNGHRAGVDVQSGQADGNGHGSYAARLGIDNFARHGMQGRGVLVDFVRVFGVARRVIGYDDFMHALEYQSTQVEPGDMLVLRTGFAEAIVAMNGDPDMDRLKQTGTVLDGSDDRLCQWITDSGISILAADNYAVENLDDEPAPDACAKMPLHHHCLFKLGLPLAELWYLEALADWLHANDRDRFMLTAPPLRLPGAVGSPVTPIATV
jgi:kynurenine formamidase